MYTKDDRSSADLLDRFIAAAIAGLFGYFFAVLIFMAVVKFYPDGVWIKWLISTLFAAYGFAAPVRSRELWSGFLNGFFSFFTRGR